MLKNIFNSIRQGNHQNEENFARCSSPRLDAETNSLTEGLADEVSLRIEDVLSRKMRYEFRKLENSILKALNSLSENSLRDDCNSPSSEITSDCENTISVQPASHGQDLYQEKFVSIESFIGAPPNFSDIADF